MKKVIIFIIFINLIGTVFSKENSFKYKNFELFPIRHGSFVIKVDETTIIVDPVGKVEAYKRFGKPDILLLTDIHRDHLNAGVLNALKTDKTIIVGPKAVKDKYPHVNVLMKNHEEKKIKDINFKATPMYNLTKERLKYHKKGRGNGYILSYKGVNFYISGDTEDIPEMRKLKDIDVALVCMNLPYTMTYAKAASAVLEFKPKYVIPFHYRGTDVEKFKTLVGFNPDIKVKLLKWYD